jgi:DNA-binding NarL/FixJ family response regulator
MGFARGEPALFKELNDTEGMAWSLYFLGRVRFAQGDTANARVLAEEALVLCREMKHQDGLARALDLLGQCALRQGEISRAQVLFKESLALFRLLGEQRNIAWALFRVARAVGQADNVAAFARYQESLALFREMDDPGGLASCLKECAELVAKQGEATWAARLWGAAESLQAVKRSHDIFILPDMYTGDEQLVAATRAQLGQRAFAKALAEGRLMTPEQALAGRDKPLISDRTPAKSDMKAGTDTHQRPSPTYPHGLTGREVEVLRLVARGLTDAQIAEELVISPRTVNAHLRSIYNKFGITSRNASTYVAIEHQLI